MSIGWFFSGSASRSWDCVFVSSCGEEEGDDEVMPFWQDAGAKVRWNVAVARR